MSSSSVASASSVRQKRVKMRRDKGDTVRGQARNGRPRRQLRNLAVVFTFLLAACGRSETGRENVDNPEGLSDRKRGLGALIRGSSSFAAVSADESRAAEIGPPTTKVVLYCRTGRRSAVAFDALQKAGYANLYDFGSVTAWPGELAR